MLPRPRTLLTLLALAGCGSPSAAPAQAVKQAAPAGSPAAPTEPAPTLPGRLVFLSESGAESAIVAMHPDGSGRQELRRGAGLYPAAVDPSGAALAVITVEEKDGGHVERLQVLPWTTAGLGPAIWQSPPAAQVRNPSWGPAGRFLVFEAALDSFRDIYRVELPAGTLLRLTDNEQGNFEPAVSPDGQTVAFVSSRDGNAEVYTMHADGSEQVRRTEAPLDDWGPLWAPDGKTLAFLSNRELVDRIFLMRPDGGELRRLTADPNPHKDPDAPLGDEPHETDAAFAPGGASLAFCVRIGSQGAPLRVAPAARGPARPVPGGAPRGRSPVWSPDGTHLVFVSNQDAGDLELYRISRDGAGRTRLSEHEGADWLPRWSPR